MSDKTSLGDRMKKFEKAFRGVLPPRMPIILRVDGKSFHTYTKKCKKPFDQNLMECMNLTAKKLCETIQGAQLAYIQSDEISILIHGYKRYASQPWFEGQIQKMTSVSASVAAVTFTQESGCIWAPDFQNELTALYNKPAYFDSRVFVLPEAEVANYFGWRQQDMTRNSVQMLARSLYSHSECHKKNNSQLQEMCFQKGHNWNDLPVSYKRGRCVLRNQGQWSLDNDIPIFFQQREYIEDFLKVVPE